MRLKEQRRLPPSARSLVVSAVIVGDTLYGDDHPYCVGRPRGVSFFMQAQQSIVVDPKSPGSINSPHGLILFDA